MGESQHLYKEGNYRFWLNTESGSLQLKLDGSKELYTIPKNTKLYERILNDQFNRPVIKED